MIFYFGKVPKEYLNHDEHLTHNNVSYYYSLEVKDTDITISDTCGRYMPIDVDNIATLGKLLTDISTYNQAKNNFDSLWGKYFANYGST